MRKVSAFLLRLTGLLILGTLTMDFAVAGTNNDVPSCYQANKMQYFSDPYDRLAYILIDQTVQLDDGLKKSVLNNMVRLLQPGTKFIVAEFSAFSQDRYLQVINTGIIENPIPEDHVGDVVMSRLQSFKTCLKNQTVFAQKLALKAAYNVMVQSASSLHHSDILMALKTISVSIKDDPAKQKLIFLISDGLENSAVTSFYSNGTIRKLNVAAELTKVKDNQLLPDFGKARVYVLGGAMLPASKSGTRDQRDGYRNPQKLVALKQFWTTYFGKSGADLIEFGEPALVQPITY